MEVDVDWSNLIFFFVAARAGGFAISDLSENPLLLLLLFFVVGKTTSNILVGDNCWSKSICTFLLWTNSEASFLIPLSSSNGIAPGSVLYSSC